MSKTVEFKKPKARKAAATSEADTWVSKRSAATPTDTEPQKRLTIDISASLHTRVKAGCAVRGTKMRSIILELLEAEFPDSQKYD